jgi:hypothetical protein
MIPSIIWAMQQGFRRYFQAMEMRMRTSFCRFRASMAPTGIPDLDAWRIQDWIVT